MINIWPQHLGWMWENFNFGSPMGRLLSAGSWQVRTRCFMSPVKSGVVRLSPNTEGLLLIAVLHAPVCLVPITLLPFFFSSPHHK